MNLPALRFKEFNEPWIDETIGKLIHEFRLGGDYSNSETETPFPLIKMGNLDRGTIKLNKIEFIEESEVADPKDKIVFGDLFFNTRNTLDLVGKVAIWKNELPCAYYNSNLMLMKFSNNFFMNFRLNSPVAVKKLRAIATGTTSVAAIYNKDLFQIKLETPSLTEQTKIANFLTAVDEKITQLTQKHDLLNQYKNGVMQQIFSQELRFKDDDGQDFPEWQESCIGEVASFIKDGTHGTHQDTVDGEYLLLSAKNIKDGGIYYDESDRKISKLEFQSIYKNYKLHDGDVLLSVVGTIGRVAIYSSEFKNVAFQRSVAFFRFNNQNSQFIAQLFTAKQFQNDLITNQVVSAQAGIYLGDLSKIKVKLPCLTEQTKIANLLTTIDEKITATKTQAQAVKQYKHGLLQQMFV
ncbi:MAG: restriction endonuclease subunit S [Methylotenera sp.]|uniref:restriction endonuclease subunit S n=1 Tax=Methylotenera sp. TaxID=2051956 RepID=UPI0017F1E9FD|nr:restriction endonuclease subunit S [Methylotenera sp.]NOU24103.1 restriction endonuclease subunit S [Methylotenera sp.]